MKQVHRDTNRRLIACFYLISRAFKLKNSERYGGKKPTYGNGKICYLEIPAIDIEASASFYSKTFGWKIRTNSEGSTAFDDGVGEVSGMWILNRKPMREAGIIISIMVDDADATSALVTANGGRIVYSSKMDSGEVIVHFTDPAGNFMGIYQER